MKSFRRVLIAIFFAMSFALLHTNVYAAPVDYNSKSVKELDDIITEKNAQIDKHSKNLAKTNSNCIELIKKNQGNNRQEFIAKINQYTETMKKYTETIRKQKNSCYNKSEKLKKVRLEQRKIKTIKKNQIKYISSQNKLIKTLKNAKSESGKLVKYIKTTTEQTIENPTGKNEKQGKKSDYKTTAR